MSRTIGFPSAMAMLDHMLEGHQLSLLEAMAMFGVCNPAAELTKFRKFGYSIKSRRVAMVKIIVRMNKYMVMKTPSQLPTKECLMMEYWIEK
jgi:hypothetical protein|tara:strand:+ start:469 stop:744 length:276 start_codon:yes stop_codon:yes gene_type:complete